MNVDNDGNKTKQKQNKTKTKRETARIWMLVVKCSAP